MKRVILKDGIIVERRAFSLNVNKNRRYRIILNNEVIGSNLLYSDLRYVLKMIRNSMKERKKQWDIQCITQWFMTDAYVIKFVLLTDE